MIEHLSHLPPHLRARLAAALDARMLAMPYAEPTLATLLGRREGADAVAAALRDLDRMGISGPAAGAWIRSLDAIASHVSKPDLVWSGPEVPGLHARDTRRVYDELLGSAEHSVLASTYVFFDGPKAFEVLAHRMDEHRSLNVTLLLNIQRRRGDTTAPDQLVRRFADRFWTTDWPGDARPTVFYDPRSLELDGPAGVLHAKAVVVDEETLFVTSANLTEAALDRNIEIGLLVRDRAIALTVTEHFRALIDGGLLHPLPAS